MSLAERIRQRLASYPLDYGPKDPRVEQMRFPALVRLFKELAEANAWMPPTQHEFALVVALRVGLQGDLAEGIKGRAGRAYISLAVQLHALAVLKEGYPCVLWDDVLDLKHGVDLLVIDHDGTVAGLKLRCPGDPSTQHAERKGSTDMPVPFATRTLVVQKGEFVAGHYWLYPSQRLFEAAREALDEQRSTS